MSVCYDLMQSLDELSGFRTKYHATARNIWQVRKTVLAVLVVVTVLACSSVGVISNGNTYACELQGMNNCCRTSDLHAFGRRVEDTATTKHAEELVIAIANAARRLSWVAADFSPRTNTSVSSCAHNLGDLMCCFRRPRAFSHPSFCTAH